MRIICLIAAGAALSLAACNNSAQDKAAETKADALESQAAATSNEATETALNQQADQVEQKAGESH
ncbi:MAG TPA: hypothetical protein VF559_04240 [Caulobacteraceae bacterium]|jgi:hypothetical protein